MKELRLKYTDEYGEPQRVSVSSEIFTAGRHPENDLHIPDNRLSREHIRIEQFNDAFYVSDSNSSNGTTINGERLGAALILKNGDLLNLGGAVNIQIEIGADAQIASQPAAVESAYTPNIEFSNQAAPSVQNVASNSSSIPAAVFWMVPIFGVVILGIVGAVIFILSGKKEVVQNNEIEFSTPTTRTPRTSDSLTADETPTPRKIELPGGSNSGAANSPETNAPPAPKTSADSEKVEQNAAAFLRRIAQNDPKAFLTGKQTETVNSKINQLKSSGALAENLKAVKKNQAQFESLASSKNLKAQFLATAALAKIGNSRGDPLAVAQTMLPVLNELKITLDNKLADDNLLIIAAYERGAAGKPRSLQSQLEALSKATQNVSPREIRTIWFLREKDKISQSEFDFAVLFLAIGAITQNPKDFNVAADAVALTNMENSEDWVTGNVRISVGGEPLDLTMTVPAKPVKPQRMLPIFEQMTNSFVGMSEQAVENAGGRISCHKGCAACCRQAIPLAEIEAYKIAAMVEALPDARRAEIVNRFDAAWHHFSKIGWFKRLDECAEASNEEREKVVLEYFHENVACPFLENECCSIHDARPLACREYLVTSPPENCSAPSKETVRMVVHPIKTSDTVRKITNSENLNRAVNFVPLVLALEWTRANADPFPERTGEQWMAAFFTNLTKSEIPK